MGLRVVNLIASITIVQDHAFSNGLRRVLRMPALAVEPTPLEFSRFRISRSRMILGPALTVTNDLSWIKADIRSDTLDGRL